MNTSILLPRNVIEKAIDSAADVVAQNILKRSAEFYEKSEPAITKMYGKAAPVVTKAMKRAMRMRGISGRTLMLTSFGIGIGVGIGSILYLRERNRRRSYVEKLTRPMAEAFSRDAQAIFKRGVEISKKAMDKIM